MHILLDIRCCFFCDLHENFLSFNTTMASSKCNFHRLLHKRTSKIKMETPPELFCSVRVHHTNT